MFRGLRFRLTALYLAAAVLLIILIGGATYLLIDRYFQSTTDASLQHKLALELGARGVPLPSEIAAADRDWYAGHGGTTPAGAPSVQEPDGKENEEQDSGVATDEDGEKHELEEAFDGDLAAIFVIPLGANGQEIATGGNAPSGGAPISPDRQALQAALAGGVDWRTVQVSGSTRVRLLTYPLPEGAGAAALQLGRTLADQDRLLNRLLFGLLGLSVLSMLLLGIASWWMAGRSLRPAQQAWERQQSFVANASHELRTPLTLMRASTEVAARQLPASDGETRELLNDVLQECDYMSSLVDDLLLLSRLDAGKLALERTTVSVQEAFGDVYRQVGRVAKEKGVRLESGGAAGSILADPTRLRQVLLILLDNALRHTPCGGSIELAARRAGSHMHLSISDTGTGIEPEHLRHVFERFYHVPGKEAGEDSSREREGSGLGLSIARGLVEAQHGQLWIESTLGRGTRAVVALPAAS